MTQTKDVDPDNVVPLAAETDWPHELYRTLRRQNVTQVSYVPDAGHTRTINLFKEDSSVSSTVLTTEEEGIALSAGAWLGGARSVVLMQSSGVGNCINMLSLPVLSRSPLLMLVTMRGEWHEFNPWQMPMARAVDGALRAIGVHTVRVDDAADLASVVESAAIQAYESDQQIAILMSQRLLGGKKW